MRQSTFFDELFTMDMGGATTKDKAFESAQREQFHAREREERAKRERESAEQARRFREAAAEGQRRREQEQAKAKPDPLADFAEKVRQAQERQRQREQQEQAGRAEAKGFQDRYRAANANWEMLGIPRTSGRDEIIAAYRKAAQFHHPDHKDTGSEEQFKALGAEYAAAIQHARRMGFAG